MTGANARASGIDWDLRRDDPYADYDQYTFNVPVRTEGDVYARYLVRVAEMRESVKIARQAFDRLPDGPILTSDRKIALPPRAEIERSMEALIHHFKLVTEGYKPPIGEVYQCIESPRGEFGVYLISDGTGRPYRCHFRAPSFAYPPRARPLLRGRPGGGSSGDHRQFRSRHGRGGPMIYSPSPCPSPAAGEGAIQDEPQSPKLDAHPHASIVLASHPSPAAGEGRGG